MLKILIIFKYYNRKKVVRMCGHEYHDNSRCLCNKICGIIKLLVTGAIIGTIAGMVGMYFFDHDRCMQRNARKMLQGAEDFTHNIKSKLDENLNK